MEEASHLASLEVILQTELHIARADLGAGDLAKGARSIRGAGIGEDRVIADVGRFQPELQALALGGLPALQQRGIERIDRRTAQSEIPRSRTPYVDGRLREGSHVEVVIHAVVDRARRAGVADQVGPLRAVPDVAAVLRYLQRRSGLQRQERAQFPAADYAVDYAVGAGREMAAAPDRNLVVAGGDEAMRDIVAGERSLQLEIQRILEGCRTAQPRQVAGSGRDIVDRLRPGVVHEHGHAAREALLPLDLQAVVDGVRGVRFRAAGAIELRHVAQQPVVLHRGRIEVDRLRIGDDTVEGIRHLGLQRRAADAPVGGIERRQAGVGIVEAQAAAAGVVDFEHRVPADFALNGDVPRVHFGVLAGGAYDGARATAQERLVALSELPSGRVRPLG